MKEKIFKKGIARRLLSVVLALAMVVALLPMNSMKAYAADTSGDFGEGNCLHWELVGDTLIISGNGEMPDFENPPTGVPWSGVGASIVNVVIESGVKSVGRYAFNLHGTFPNIASVTLPEGLERIGRLAFRGCENLTSISLPSSLKTIDEGAFTESGLTSIEIPKNISNLNGSSGNGIFEGCFNLTTVTFAEGFSYTNIPDYMFDGCGSLTSIAIPASVTSIGSGAFNRCGSLTNITIPENVTSIGIGAFDNCGSLTNITIPSSVTSIEGMTFSNCRSLTNITIPASVTSIGDGVFSECSSLTNITIPASVTSIGDGVFSECSNLTFIKVDAITPPTMEWPEWWSLFYREPSRFSKIYVPQASVAAYKAAAGWSQYEDKIEGFHDFTYSVTTTNTENDTIKATCGKPEICDLTTEDKSVSLTLTASSANYSGSAATITLEGEDAWENAEIAVPEIKYFKGSEALTEAPTTPGDYTAKISAGDPAVIASVDYTILVEKSAEEVEAVKNAIDKIAEIGTVEYTDACKAKIDAAREAYDALEEHLTSLVTNYNVLTTAEAKYAELKAAAEKLEADTVSANAVDALIKAIGKVEYTDACKAKIDAARKAYDALTEDQKKLVKELKTLEDAEKAYEALKPTPSPDPTPTPAPTPGPDPVPTPSPVPTPETIVLGTSYDTIQTGETVTSKGKVTGITISANSISMNGILTVNSKLKITILDGKWSVAGYSEDRVTPETLNSVKWLAVDGTKKDAKLLKKYAKSKYYKATKKKGAKTLITAGLNKKDIDGVYAVKLVDDQGHTFVLNIECNKAAKISKKDALKITEAGKSVSANDILAMADGESVKTISLSYVGKDKKVSKSLFNNNAITWKVGTGKKAQTIKCGEVTEYKTKKGDVIGYLTVTEDGSVKVLAGSVKGKLSLSATVNGKAYKTSVSIKK